MCQVKGCTNEGVWAPKLDIRMRDRITRQEWDIPIIANLAICDRCRTDIREPSDVLADGGDRAVASLLAMRKTAKLVSKKVGWLRRDSEEFGKFTKTFATDKPS
jgi:hypothetical protein